MATKATLSPLWKEALATTEDYQSQLNQINDWFMGTQQKTQATADYDISQAYAAYKKQTMQAMNTASMAEGTKERLAEEGRNQFESTASQINEGLAENTANATTQYTKLLNNWQSNLEQQAETSAKTEEALWNFANDWGYTEYTDEDTKLGKSDWFSKYYSGGQLTQEGKEILERVMYGDGVDSAGNKHILTNELIQQNPELYEFYTSNQDYFNKMLLGITDAGYRGEGYNWENRQSEKDRLATVKENANKRGININGDFNTATEELTAYREQYKRLIENEIENELDTAYKSVGTKIDKNALIKKLEPFLTESIMTINDIDVDNLLTNYIRNMPKKGLNTITNGVKKGAEDIVKWVSSHFR